MTFLASFFVCACTKLRFSSSKMQVAVNLFVAFRGLNTLSHGLCCKGRLLQVKFLILQIDIGNSQKLRKDDSRF